MSDISDASEWFKFILFLIAFAAIICLFVALWIPGGPGWSNQQENIVVTDKINNNGYYIIIAKNPDSNVISIPSKFYVGDVLLYSEIKINQTYNANVTTWWLDHDNKYILGVD